MTRIKIYKSNRNEIVGFRAEGHSGYANAGQDIVCAAISTLVTNTVNSIETFTEDAFDGEVDEKKAIIAFRLKSEASSECAVLLKSFELGVTCIAENNSKYVSVTFEEV